MEFLEGSRVNTDVSDFSVGDPNSPKKDDIGSGDILMSALKQTLQSQNKTTSSSKTSTEITYAPHEDEIKDQVINQVYLPETNPSLKRKISFGGILTKLKNKEKEKHESDDDLEMGCRVKTLDS